MLTAVNNITWWLALCMQTVAHDAFDNAPSSPCSTVRDDACRSASLLTQTATKALFTSYHAHFPLVLCLAQMSFTALVCGLISGKTLDVAVFLRTVPLGLVNFTNILSGLFATGMQPTQTLPQAHQSDLPALACVSTA